MYFFYLLDDEVQRKHQNRLLELKFYESWKIEPNLISPSLVRRILAPLISLWIIPFA